MKKTTLAVTLAGVFLLAIAASNLYAFGYGQGRGPWGGHGGYSCGDGMGPGISGAALTAEQTGKLKELHDAHAKAVAPLRDKMLTKRAELGLLWLQPNPDREKINAAQKEMRTLRDKMQDEMTSLRLDMLKVLTPEQRTRFQAGAARHGFGGGCGGGMRGGMMGPGSCDGPHHGR